MLVSVHVAALLVACGGGGSNSGDGGEPVEVHVPTILVEPHDLTLVAGESATLEATASGPGITYQWQSSGDGQTWTDVANGTSPTLSLGAVTPDATSTVYRLQVLNGNGSVASRTVRLAVDATPTGAWFTREAAGATVVAGQSADFSVGVVNATRVTWQSSADLVHWSDIDRVGQTLTTGALTLADDGKYFRAVASNSSGSVYSDPAWLRVAASAVAPAGSSNSSAALWRTTPSGDATVAMMSEAVPAPTVTWQVSADNGATYVDFQGESQAHDLTDNQSGSSLYGKNTFSQITIARASLDKQSLMVRATLTNSAGSWTSSALTLPRNNGPFIASQPSDQSTQPGQDRAAFEVRAVGDGLSYQWQASRDGGVSYADIAGATSASWLQPDDESVDHLRVRVTSAGATSTSRGAALARSRWQTTHPALTGETLVSLAWKDAQTVLAVGSRSRILRSGDGGTNWQVVSAPVNERSAWGAIAVNTQPGGTGTALAVDLDGRIRRSADGAHWVTLDEPYQFIFRFTGSFHNLAYADAKTAVAVGLGIIRSTDDGRTWTSAVISGPAMPTLNAIAFNKEGVGLAGGVDGTLLRSLDAGAHWAAVETDVGTADLETVTFVSSQVALAAGSQGVLLRSEDAGATWTRVDVSFTQRPEETFNSVAMRNSLRGTIASDEGLYLTSDGGKTWAPSQGGTQYLAVGYSPLGAAAAVGDYGTIQLSPNGGATWVPVAGSSNGAMRGVAFASADVGVAVTESGRMMRTGDRGQTWATVVAASGLSLDAVAFADANTGVAVGANGFALRTVDAGQSWSPLSDLGSIGLVDVAFSSPTNGVVASYDGLYRSVDSGASWALVRNTSVRAVRFGSATTGMAVGDNGIALRTSNGGQTWSTVTISAGVDFESVWYLDANTVLVRGRQSGQPHQLYRSTDGGSTWSPITLAFDLVKAAFASPNLGLAVDEDGHLYRSTDGGLSWTVEYWGEAFPVGGLAFADAHTAVAVYRYGNEVKRRADY